jgi:hypothetical protein
VVFGQLLDGATGAETGPDDFQISDIGPRATGEYGAGAFCDLGVGTCGAGIEELLVLLVNWGPCQ